MLLGGAGVSNLELLKRARAMEPGARIIWRPHPDVEAGLRRGRWMRAGWRIMWNARRLWPACWRRWMGCM
jgi:capsule polysaccharide export protein KpsC/LpsZ